MIERCSSTRSMTVRERVPTVSTTDFSFACDAHEALDRPLEIRGHRVERFVEMSDLVVAIDDGPLREIALRDAARARDERQDRPNDEARSEVSREDGQQQREDRHADVPPLERRDRRQRVRLVHHEAEVALRLRRRIGAVLRERDDEEMQSAAEVDALLGRERALRQERRRLRLAGGERLSIASETKSAYSTDLFFERSEMIDLRSSVRPKRT